MALTDAPHNTGVVSIRRIMPEDIQAQAGIPLQKLLMADATLRFAGANKTVAVQHNLGVVPILVSTRTQSPTTSAVVYWETRPADKQFVYLACSVANTVCRVLIAG